jgi:orotidine-5'-phosphate decarboxylase
MTKQELFNQIIKKESFLCVGLDADLEKIPDHLLELDDPIFEFNKQIIDATKDFCVAYKPNLAFYESLGVKGWESLQKTMEYIPSEIFTIADAKRGDIGNTSRMYAKTFFEYFNFDSVTVAPYMGNDSVSPFLEFSNKWVILLAATSNVGGLDFQYKKIEGGKRVFEGGDEENLMYVVGATRAEMLSDVRAIVPNAFLLVPGVGAQGGSLEEVVKYGMNDTCGLLVNSSRGIIYAGSGNDFASAAGKKSKELQSQMAVQLKEFGLLKK